MSIHKYKLDLISKIDTYLIPNSWKLLVKNVPDWLTKQDTFTDSSYRQTGRSSYIVLNLMKEAILQEKYVEITDHCKPITYNIISHQVNYIKKYSNQLDIDRFLYVNFNRSQFKFKLNLLPFE